VFENQATCKRLAITSFRRQLLGKLLVQCCKLSVEYLYSILGFSTKL